MTVQRKPSIPHTAPASLRGWGVRFRRRPRLHSLARGLAECVKAQRSKVSTPPEHARLCGRRPPAPLFSVKRCPRSALVG
jgi:hypothetical protein